MRRRFAACLAGLLCVAAGIWALTSPSMTLCTSCAPGGAALGIVGLHRFHLDDAGMWLGLAGAALAIGVALRRGAPRLAFSAATGAVTAFGFVAAVLVTDAQNTIVIVGAGVLGPRPIQPTTLIGPGASHTHVSFRQGVLMTGFDAYLLLPLGTGLLAAAMIRAARGPRTSAVSAEPLGA